MDYKYDVFISYASEDTAWALKLEESLRLAGITVFLDNQRIDAGSLWEEVLKNAMKASHHLVVLWSIHASQSHWVPKETIWFNYEIKPDQRQITVFLEDVPPPLDNSGKPQAVIDNRIQHITTISKGGLYAPGAKAIDRQIWEQVISQILTGLDAKDLRKPINRIAFTVSQKEFDSIPFDQQDTIDTYSLNDVLALLGHSKDTIRSQYGKSKSDWKPFGEDSNVLMITDEILDNINREYNVNYKWVSLDEDLFWNGTVQDAEKQIKELAKKPSLIIVDPIALFNRYVKKRFEMLGECFQNKNALVIAFSLFAPPANYLLSRKIIEFGDYDFHKNYFRPAIPKSNLIAQIAANPVDRGEASRFIQNMISQSYAPPINSGKTYIAQ